MVDFIKRLGNIKGTQTGTISYKVINSLAHNKDGMTTVKAFFEAKVQIMTVQKNPYISNKHI